MRRGISAEIHSECCDLFFLLETPRWIRRIARYSFKLMKHLHTLILTAAACGTAMAADGWTDLFNGKDLDGWVKRGGRASYAVEGDSIVGTSTLNTENTFLCTPRDYSDFILEYEFKVDPKLNSGVQIRSQSFPEAKEIELQGKKFYHL